MKLMNYTFILSLALIVSSDWAVTTSLDHYKTLTLLEDDWILSPADEQEGGATKFFLPQNLSALTLQRSSSR